MFLAWFSMSLVVSALKEKTPAKAGLLSLFINIQEIGWSFKYKKGSNFKQIQSR